MVNQIEDDSKAVLEILTAALDAGSLIGMARQIEADHRPPPGLGVAARLLAGLAQKP